MRRLSNEDGYFAAQRNWGRFALSLIPAALGGAAVLWLLAAFGWIDLMHAQRIEQRTMQSVGITEKPTAPITMITHDADCMKIQSSFMDGREAVFYSKNTCNHWLNGPVFLVRGKAHNGTVIKSERWAFDGDRGFSPNERREERTDVGADGRLESVELYVVD